MGSVRVARDKREGPDEAQGRPGDPRPGPVVCPADRRGPGRHPLMGQLGPRAVLPGVRRDPWFVLRQPLAGLRPRVHLQIGLNARCHPADRQLHGDAQPRLPAVEPSAPRPRHPYRRPRCRNRLNAPAAQCPGAVRTGDDAVSGAGRADRGPCGAGAAGPRLLFHADTLVAGRWLSGLSFQRGGLPLCLATAPRTANSPASSSAQSAPGPCT